MRLQDFFNLVDEDRSGRLTPDELMEALYVFANRPDNPQRLHERERRDRARLQQQQYVRH
jgi:Ca2+-binding EF-hand superfamily protein